ncbi:AimR family lysis-lysogeny pheromone receptor [Priestia aryabhattai]|uniref:AimR family lysis-lysogeny pheromone receptor n=1 Tax=Priestia aryabhattai TaxID=412384 RepID=UPI0015F650F7|nr:AimR family lysis-lysogeny pheromone receptor [Priestia aryabhattai]
MIKLKQMMKNKFDDDNGLAVRAAKIKGINQPQKLYKFVSGEVKEIDNFEAVRELIEFLFPNNHEEVLIEYCNDLDPNKQFIRDAIEYATLFEKKEMQKVLLKKLKSATNTKGAEYLYFYELKGRANSLSSSEMFNELSTYNFKTQEMPVLARLMLVKVLIRETKYNTAAELIDNLEILVNNMKDSYFKESLKKRFHATKVSLNLRKGDHKETEKLGEQALSIHKLTPLDIYILMDMGNAYIMHDYEIAMNYFERAVALANQFNDKVRLVQVKNSIDFCMCYWKKYSHNGQEVDENDYSDYNKAFYYISVGEKEIAEKCLESIEYGNMDDVDKAFYYFYKGLLTNERSDYFKSVKHFKNAGDKHYRKMAIIELEKLGEEEFVIETLLA